VTKPRPSSPQKSLPGPVARSEPPRFDEAEESLLACCLIDGGASIASAQDSGITAEAFNDFPNRTIWQCLVEMRRASLPIDEAILVEELKKRGQLEVSGGFVRINQLTDRIPTTAHFSYFVEQLRNQTLLRRLITVANGVIASASTAQGNVEDMVVEIERDLLAVTQQFSTVLPPLEDMTDLFAHPPPKPAEVIVGMLHARGMMNMGGQSKARKSWVLANLAIAVASGTPWLGLETRKGRVLILNFEIDGSFYTDRLRSVESAMGVSIPRGAIDVWNLAGHACDITKLRPMIMAKLQGRGYSMIVVDPLYMLLGDRDESNAGDMTDMMNEFKTLAVRCNAAVVFATHFAKGNSAAKSSLDRSSGSGVLSRYPDVVATLTELEEDESMAFEVTVRNNSPIPKFGVRWQFPIFRRDDELDPTALKQAAGASAKKETTAGHTARRLPFDPKEIVRYFPAKLENAEGLSEIMRKAQEGCGIGKAHFAAIRQELLERKWLAQDPQTRWFRTSLSEEFIM
jgi:hypothetical protein